MALRKSKDSNLSLLIHAIASAYHRGPDGLPKYQPISFKTGIASATIHLWKHSGVKSARPDFLRALADSYNLDFTAVLEYVYGGKTRLEGDALLASLRPEADTPRRLRPIAGGSGADGTLGTAQPTDKLDDYGDDLSLIRPWLVRGWGWMRRWTPISGLSLLRLA